ncbi:hypothetical protein J7643_03925 [bacterium]|nr:hypothetical protein [bacterium]
MRDDEELSIDPGDDEQGQDLIAEIEALWEQLQDGLPPEERTNFEGTPRSVFAIGTATQLRLFVEPDLPAVPGLDAHELFDETVPLEASLQKLCRWIAARRGKRCTARQRSLLRWHLETRAAAIPLHLVFEGEPSMQVTILNPAASRDWDDEVPVLDGWHEEQFLRRFSGIREKTLDYLQDAESKYMVLLGLEPWHTFYATEVDFLHEVASYELIITLGRSGLVEHVQEAFAYLVARDRGIDAETAATFQRFKLLYLFAKGLATDDEIPSLDDEDEVLF